MKCVSHNEILIGHPLAYGLMVDIDWQLIYLSIYLIFRESMSDQIQTFLPAHSLRLLPSRPSNLARVQSS